MSYVGFCPPGVILPYAGSTAPEGWLLCDGSAISQTTYPALFAAIGSAYNTQVNPTTNAVYAAPAGGLFRLPDYRASFLRGVGTPYAGDAVTLGGFQTHKTAQNGLAASSAGMSANTTHGHGISDPTHGHTTSQQYAYTRGGSGTNVGGPDGYFHHGLSNGVNGNSTGVTVNTSGSIDHSHGISISSDTETRPHNKGVNYIIKI